MVERDEDLTTLHVKLHVVLKETWISFHFLVIPHNSFKLKDNATTEEKRQEAKAEVKALRIMTERMILT